MATFSHDQEIDSHFSNALGLRKSQIPLVLVNQLERQIELLTDILFRVSVSSEEVPCSGTSFGPPGAGVPGEPSEEWPPPTQPPPPMQPRTCCRAIISPPEGWPAPSPQVVALLPHFSISAGATDPDAGELSLTLEIDMTPTLAAVNPNRGCKLRCHPDYVGIDVNALFKVTLRVSGSLKQARSSPSGPAGAIAGPVVSFGPLAGTQTGSPSLLPSFVSTSTVTFNFQVSFSFTASYEYDFLCGAGLGPRGTLQPVMPLPVGPPTPVGPGVPAIPPIGGSTGGGPRPVQLQDCEITPRLLAVTVLRGPANGRVVFRITSKGAGPFHKAVASPFEPDDDITLDQSGSGTGVEADLPMLTLRDNCTYPFTFNAELEYTIYDGFTLIDQGTVILHKDNLSCGQSDTVDRRFNIRRDPIHSDGEMFVLIDVRSRCR